MAAEPWVSVGQVAAHLDVTHDSIYRWFERKAFPNHRVGRLLRLKLSEVDEWVKAGSSTIPTKRKASARK